MESMFEYWQEEPPVGLLVAAYLQYKPPAKPGQEDGPSGEEFRRQAMELMAMFGGSGGVVR